MASLSVGIVGLPNVGKSTLFNALTLQKRPAENFPFCTIDPYIGSVKVPDDRIDKLSSIIEPEKTTYPILEFVDIAGLIKGAASGEGLGNEFLVHIRDTDAIANVVRVFDDKKIIHTENYIDPIRDIDIIATELMLKDLSIAEKKLKTLKKETKTVNKQIVNEEEFLTMIEKNLKMGNQLRNIEMSSEEMDICKQLGFLSSKPVLFILNTSISGENKKLEGIKKFLIDNNEHYIILDIKTECEIVELGGNTKEMREEMKMSEKGIASFIRASYKLLELITFFTIGKKEVKGWTTKKSSTAPQAGYKIHSDFQTKFIRAQVLSFQNFLKFKSQAKAKENGVVKIVGKDYIVLDGDIIEFLI